MPVKSLIELDAMVGVDIVIDYMMMIFEGEIRTRLNDYECAKADMFRHEGYNGPDPIRAAVIKTVTLRKECVDFQVIYSLSPNGTQYRWQSRLPEHKHHLVDDRFQSIYFAP